MRHSPTTGSGLQNVSKAAGKSYSGRETVVKFGVLCPKMLEDSHKTGPREPKIGPGDLKTEP